MILNKNINCLCIAGGIQSEDGWTNVGSPKYRPNYTAEASKIQVLKVRVRWSTEKMLTQIQTKVIT